MQLNNLQSKTKFRRGQRIGRGGKRGTTSGRGTKGQKARAGHKIRPEFRDVIKRIPKLRGYKFHSFREKAVPVTLERIEKAFSKGDTVTRKILLRKGLIHTQYGKTPPVKILGNAVSKSVSVVGVPLSKHAKAAVLKAGGTVK